MFCCGKHDYGKNLVACLCNLLAAVLQCATIFLLVGWIWSVRWGILFVQLSGEAWRCGAAIRSGAPLFAFPPRRARPAANERIR